MRILVVFALALLVLGGCAQEGGEAAGTGGTSPGAAPGEASPGVAAPVEANPGNTLGPEDAPIYVRYFEFWPSVLTVEPGTTVVWVNEDSDPHIIVSDPQMGFEEGELFRSGTLNMGDTYSLTFIESGEYDYHCGLHPDMVGKVLVEES